MRGEGGGERGSIANYFTISGHKNKREKNKVDVKQNSLNNI